MKISEALAKALKAEECRTIFGLLGDANLSFWVALDALGDATIVSARHEAGAIAMADGYHRATGRVGVATITSGPGVTQIGTSLKVAADNHSAIVVVTGDVAADDIHNIQNMDQKSFVEASGAAFFPITGTGNLAREIVDAFYFARTNRCPVVLNLPSDVAAKSLDWEIDYIPSNAYIARPVLLPPESDIDRLVDTILASNRIIIVAGLGAKRSGARDTIVELSDITGGLLATSLKAKGLFLDHPYDIGVAGSFACAAAEELFQEADLVIGIGAELGYYSSEGGLLFPGAKVVRIDSAPLPGRLPVVPGDYVVGDARATVAELVSQLNARQVRPRTGLRTDSTREALTMQREDPKLAQLGIDPRELARALGENIAEDGLLTVGAGHYWSFIHQYLPSGPDVDLHLSYQFGAIGQTVPLAIGIGMAQPTRPQIVIEGDGSVLLNIQEFDTLARLHLPLVLIIWNDSGYGAEFHKLRAKNANDRLGRWTPVNFAAVAQAFGGGGVMVEKLADLGPAIQHGAESGGFFVVDVRVSDEIASDSFRRLHFGETNQTPRLRSAREKS